MVGDGDCLMAKAGGRFYKILGRYQAVHRGHLGMGMQLNPLELALILPLEFFHPCNAVGSDIDLPVVFVKGCLPLKHEGLPRLNRFVRPLFILIDDRLEHIRTGVIGHKDAVNPLGAILAVLKIGLKDVSPADQPPGRLVDLGKRDRSAAHRASHQLLHRIGNKGQALRVKGKFDLWRAGWFLRNAGGLEFLLNLFDHLVVRAQLGRTNKGNADLTVKLLPDQLADPLRHLIVPKLLRAAVGKGNQEVVPLERHGAVVKKSVDRHSHPPQLIDNHLPVFARQQLRSVAGDQPALGK